VSTSYSRKVCVQLRPCQGADANRFDVGIRMKTYDLGIVLMRY